MLVGAAIGAGAGALTGATTDPQDVNLGRPPWTNPEARVPGVSDDAPRSSVRRAARADTREAQQALGQAGYDPGPSDGVWGAQSARAARDFQRANNLTETGRLDSATRAALRGRAGTGTPPPATR
jgi:peptidoglycan hydrolase-like protein with peptidoglycan-binding domain